VFDADNHYNEELDAFTGTSIQRWVHGRSSGANSAVWRNHVLGGRVSHAVTNPTFDPVALPGAMYEYFRSNPDRRNPMEFLPDLIAKVRSTSDKMPATGPMIR
jgi:hypothetical protein